MELIENVGHVSKDREEYPKWFQMWIKEREDENERERIEKSQMVNG